jgi:hypothetical protein
VIVKLGKPAPARCAGHHKKPLLVNLVQGSDIIDISVFK